MLCLGIDQHARQITISLRDEKGDVVMARQVSTQPVKIHEFFQRLTRERLQNGEPFVAVRLLRGQPVCGTAASRHCQHHTPGEPAADHDT